MEASLRKIKVSAYNRKLQLKKRKQARRLRATKGLDRSSFIRLRSLHPVRFQVIKVKNGRITSRSLRVAGAAGTQ
jgi:hypothetical protein